MVDSLSDKKLHDKRFATTEKTIIMTYHRFRDTICLCRFVKIAGISRATLYRHHSSLTAIIPDYERYLLRKSRNVLRRQLRNHHTSLRATFERLLVFMISHKAIIKLLTSHGRRNITEDVLMVLKPKILATGKVKNDEMFLIYIKEISGLIEEWQSAGFKQKDIPPTVNKIMYLTETAYIRLSPLASFNTIEKLK